MITAGRETVSEYILGAGLIKDRSALKRLAFQGIEESTIETMLTEKIFWPDEIMR